MIVKEISLWGAALIAVVVVVAILALAFVDRKMLRRMLTIFGATVGQMVVVGAVVLLAQPLVMVMPMLYAGMLLGGISPYVGLVIILLLIAASFVANVLAGVIALTMTSKRDKAINSQLNSRHLSIFY